MPCHCGGYPDPEPDLHNGFMAEALCEIMQEHEARGDMDCFGPATLAWWKEHKKRDKKRVKLDLLRAQRTKGRAAALAKLSAYEKWLLSLEE